MKKTTFYVLSAFMALFTALPTNAQKLIHLTFQRSGSTASSVTVNVTNENDETVNGVTASLESVKQGSGVDNYTTLSDVSLENLNSAIQQYNAQTLWAKYNNQQNDFVVYTFKISGLQNNFTFDHADLKLTALNSEGQFQAKMDRMFFYQVWTSNTMQAGSEFAKIENANLTMYGSGMNKYNGHDWEMKSNSDVTATNEQYITLRILRTDNNGCYHGLEGITLYKGYQINTTSTNNLGKVSTFSAGKQVDFPNDVTAYIATTNDGSNVTLSPLNGSLKPNNGAIVTSTKDVTHAFVSTTAPDTRVNLLEGSGDAAKTLTAGSYYIFNKNTDGNAIFSILGSDKLTLAANKAALKAKAIDEDGGYSQALNIIFDSPTTSISTNVVSNASANAKVYDLQGRSVKNNGALRSGIYVKNGKKIIVK